MVRFLWVPWGSWQWDFEWVGVNSTLYRGAVFLGPVTIDFWVRD